MAYEFEDEGGEGVPMQFGAEGGSDYGEHYGALERSQLQMAETPYSFVSEAVLDEEGQALVDELIQLQDWQANAACNRRYGRIRDLRRRLKHLLYQADEDTELMQDEPMDEWSVFGVMSDLPEAEIEELAAGQSGRAKGRITSLLTEIVQLQESVERDQRDGHFRDYTAWAESFNEENPYGAGSKAVDSPFFGQEARSFCGRTAQDTRRDHAQSLWAKMVQKLGLMGVSQQRMAQQGGRRRRPQGASQGGQATVDYGDGGSFE